MDQANGSSSSNNWRRSISAIKRNTKLTKIMQSQLREKEEENAKLQDELTFSKLVAQNQQEKIAGYKKMEKDLQTEQSDLSNENIKLKKENTRLHSSISSLEANNEELESLVTQLKAQLDDTTKQKDRFEQELLEMSAQINDLHQTFDNFVVDNLSASETSSSADTPVQQLENTLNNVSEAKDMETEESARGSSLPVSKERKESKARRNTSGEGNWLFETTHVISNSSQMQTDHVSKRKVSKSHSESPNEFEMHHAADNSKLGSFSCICGAKLQSKRGFNNHIRHHKELSRTKP